MGGLARGSHVPPSLEPRRPRMRCDGGVAQVRACPRNQAQLSVLAWFASSLSHAELSQSRRSLWFMPQVIFPSDGSQTPASINPAQ